MHFAAWSQDYPDPSNFLDPLFTSASKNDEDTFNTAFYSTPALDDLLSRARVELDTSKRQRLYDQAVEIVCDDAPWAFTHYNHFFEIRQPYVRGYRPHPIFQMNVGRAWIDRASGARVTQRDLPPAL